jgi:uncharacterized OB-fold protein
LSSPSPARRESAPEAPARPEPLAAGEPPRRDPPPRPSPWTLLDFYPPEDPRQTRIAPFFDALKEGRFVTTECPLDGRVHWPPAVACPVCHQEGLRWHELPRRGTLYAFSEVRGGAPLGMEEGVPFVVGMVDLPGEDFRLFSRIVGAPFAALHIGDEVQWETYPVGDGRTFYRYRRATP